MVKQEWFSKKDAGLYAGKASPRTVHSWIHERGLRFAKVGGTVLIKKEWLDAFLENHEDKGQADRIVDETINDLG